MEIVFKNVYTDKLKNINLSITNKNIFSLISTVIENEKEFINLFVDNNIKKGEIYIDNELMQVEDFPKNSYIVKTNIYDTFFNINIKEDLKYYLGNYDNNKLEELLNSFNIDYEVLDKCYMEISSSEAKKLSLIIALMINKKILIIEEPTKNLDYKATQTLKKHLKKLKREDKIVIINSKNTNFILEVSDDILVLDNNTLTNKDSKYNILSNEKILNSCNLKMPDVLLFIEKIKKIKNIKLNNRDNINDLIKDIYRYAK